MEKALRKDYVVGFLFLTEHNQVVLVKKERPDWQKGLWNGPGGKIREGETPHTCMTREFREETGVSIPPEEWDHILTLYSDKYECHFFRAFSSSPRVYHDLLTADIKRDEVTTLWPLGVPMATHSNVVSDLSWVIPLMLDSRLDLETGQVLRIGTFENPGHFPSRPGRQK